MTAFSFAELQEHLKRPALYERTREAFWNDPYIATQMLAAHLDPGIDAASRRPETIDRSVAWMLSLVPKGARLLDIGCGPGLYTKRLAEGGLRVTGLDFSAGSIAYARAHDGRSEYILQDYLAMDFEGAFDIVTLIYCDYGALIPRERRELLRRVHRALKPGGLFVLDVFTPRRAAGRREAASWELHENGGFWSPEPHICLDASFFYGETAEARRTVVIQERGVRCFLLWDCYFTRQSLLEEAAPAGFGEAGFYSDATGRPFADDSPAMCAVFRKILHR
ncbi:MAG: class I SAM-dependent methyltransferase [Clostridia bacterium]|nr:class I SAM-dependent methyltransferase [Clostridia bacterium]